MKSARMRRRLVSLPLLLLLALGWTGQRAVAGLIDIPLPPFEDPPSPWESLAGESIITFAFKTSADGTEWTAEQKAVAYAAINCLDYALPDQQFVESNDFTIRWGGADFFKDWQTKDANGNPTGPYSHPGWNLTGLLACAYKHNNGPWDANLFPNNEIYINQNQPWNFDPNGPAPGLYDLYTVLLHEMIHMLACDAHAADPNEVMYETLEMGVRKELQESDLQILRSAGYVAIPEPGLAMLLVLAGCCVLRKKRPEGRRSSRHSASP